MQKFVVLLSLTFLIVSLPFVLGEDLTSQQKRKLDQARSNIEKADKATWVSQTKSYLKIAEQHVNSLLQELPDHPEVKKLKEYYDTVQKSLPYREAKEQLRSIVDQSKRKLDLFAKKAELSSIDRSTLQGFMKDIEEKTQVLSQAEGYADILKEAAEISASMEKLLGKDKPEEVDTVTQPVEPKPDTGKDLTSQQKKKLDQVRSNIEKADKATWVSQAKSYLKSTEYNVNSLLQELPDHPEVKKLKEYYDTVQKSLPYREAKEQLRSIVDQSKRKLDLFAKKAELSSIDRSTLQDFMKDIEEKTRVLSQAEGYADILKEAAEISASMKELLAKEKPQEVSTVTQPIELRSDRNSVTQPVEPQSDTQKAQEKLRTLLDRAVKMTSRPKSTAPVEKLIKEIEAEARLLSNVEGCKEIIEKAEQTSKRLQELIEGSQQSDANTAQNIFAMHSYNEVVKTLAKADELIQKGDIYHAEGSYRYAIIQLQENKASIEGAKGKEVYEELLAKATAGREKCCPLLVENQCKDALENAKRGNGHDMMTALSDCRSFAQGNEEALRIISDYEPKVITQFYETLLIFLKEVQKDPVEQKQIFDSQLKFAKTAIGQKPELLKIAEKYEPQFSEFLKKIGEKIKEQAEQEAAVRHMVFEKWRGEYRFTPFVEGDKMRFVLWGPATGLSVLYLFNIDRWQPWLRNQQMVQNPLKIAETENCLYASFVNKDKCNFLVWNPATGKSILYYLSNIDGWQPWRLEEQLPQNPLNISANETCRFVPFVDQERCHFLVWNPATGKSILYYLSNIDGWKPWGLEEQLPQNPLNISSKETCRFVPFADKERCHFLVWNPATGKSILYYLSNIDGWKPWGLEEQLPQNPLNISANETCRFVPFADKERCHFLVWNPGTGKSILYYLSNMDGWKPWELEGQLPQNPLNISGTETCQFAPFVDQEYGCNFLVWNPATGKSILYYLFIGKWQPWRLETQIPPDPVTYYVNFSLIGGK